MTKSRMSDHPILCAGSVVRAIRDGRQTQDRRPILVKGRPFLARDWAKAIQLCDGTWSFWYPGDVTKELVDQAYPKGGGVKQPWQVGDHLWVRETLHREVLQGWESPDVATYAADGAPVIGTNPPVSWCGRAVWQWKRKPAIPSIHMPKWATRIWLEVLDVRPERLQDISDEDCWAEGIVPPYYKVPGTIGGDWSVRTCFSELWDSLYAKRGLGWDDNPWVWVTTFRRIE